MSDAVLYAREGGIGRITLNRPGNRNSMTPELLGAFTEATAAAKADDEARVVVITGTGPSFSAGADFKSQLQADSGARTRLPHERSYTIYEPFMSLLDLEVPVVAAMQGHAVGGGFGMALLCDLRVAAREAKYGANFARIGLHSGLAISYLLPRLIGVPRALEMLLTGKLISGDEAAAIGLVNRAVPAESVLPTTLELAGEIAANAPLAVRLMKRTLYRGLGWDPRHAAVEEAYAQAATLETADVREGIAAFLAKRPPRFEGR
jgi:enoyl-CoA hydratase/carnithine racemase